MSNKCNFCGGDNDQPELPWCSVCNTSVSWNIARETAPKEISFEDKLTIFSNFKRWAANKENHPNYDLAFNKIKNYPTPENRELEALKKTRHNLENQIVKLNNENAKLQQDLKNASQATTQKPTEELRAQGRWALNNSYMAGNSWLEIFDAAYALIGKKNSELESENQRLKNTVKCCEGLDKAQDEHILELEKKVKELKVTLEKENGESEQLHVQLAGCTAAALGWSNGTNCAKQGDYGWSPSYQDVFNLRCKYDEVVNFCDKAEIGASVVFAQLDEAKKVRNDWEKLAGEYRFKADKLAEENKKLNLEVEDLVKEIKEYEELADDLDEENETLCEENEELCQDCEDLDTEAEQYYQEAKKLNTELDKYKWPPDYHYYYGYGLRPVPKNMLYSGLYSTL